jgi:hypothetical protein
MERWHLTRNGLRIAVAVAVGLVCVPSPLHAQYFGQNKVQYRTFDFQLLQTEHFDVYHYPEEAESAQIVSRLAERWFARLSRFFNHELRGRQALILYAAPAHFRQTNAVEGLIGEGTGGVTEALKRRIVLPMSGSLADTDHVLGHELVHAFQFDMTGADPREASGTTPGILEYPLWFVEGMAEYVSLGPVDAQTAMWMRDAALHEKLPRIQDLDDPKYFPYRWGHSFWAFIGAKYGDGTVASLVRSGANPRYDLIGLARQLGSTPDQLTADWHKAIHDAAALDIQPSLVSEPREVISHETGSGRYNIGPRVSPDGKQIVFFSERGRFAIELFVANAETGHVERKLLSSATDPHFDSLEFLDSAGAWSPDGRTLALTAVRSGRPVLVLLDPSNGHVRREVALPGLDDAINPSYSPDGHSVILSGNASGLSDLFVLRLDTGAIERLTHDPFADLEPTFTPDGKSVVFVTERFGTDFDTLRFGPLRLARLDLATHEVTAIPGFLRGKHLSPQVSADGRMITFIADPDGVSNLYRMPIDGGPILQVLSVATGVAGITSASPALSASASGRLVFSIFQDGGHAIYVLDEANIVSLVSPEATERGAVLPGRTAASGDIDRLLKDYGRGLPSGSTPAPSSKYKSGLKLDGVGQPTVSINASQFGAFAVGGISASFSDMLGDRLVGIGAQVGGKFADFGAQITYVNRTHRWNWAVSGEQGTYRNDYYFGQVDTSTGTSTVTQVTNRQYGPGLFGFVSYPLNQAKRLEFGAGVQSMWFSQEIRVQVYDPTGATVGHSDQTVPLATPLHLTQATAAFVHDTSYYGAISPIYGSRYRFQLTNTTGTLQYETFLLDWRRYFMPKRPVTFGLRLLHSGRYGPGSEDPHLIAFYAGYPELVHGYGYGSVAPTECKVVSVGTCPLVDNLLGSRILVGNFEVRAPLLGLLRHDIHYGRVPVEVGAFMDAGTAWTSTTRPEFLGGTRVLVRSIGGLARVNLLGIFLVEISAAHPLDRLNGGIQWQVGLRQGF